MENLNIYFEYKNLNIYLNDILYTYLNEEWLTNGDAAWKKDPKDTTRLHSKIVVCVERVNSELLPWPKLFNKRFVLRASSV